jgi:hypothetical protein
MTEAPPEQGNAVMLGKRLGTLGPQHSWTCLEFSGCFEWESGGIDVLYDVSIDGT